MPTPSSAYLDTLAASFLKHCPNTALVERVWPRIRPLLLRAYTDDYPLAEASSLDPVAVAKTIAEGFDTKVERVRFVSLRSQDPFGEIVLDDLCFHPQPALRANRMTEQGYPFKDVSGMEGGREYIDTFLKELGSPLAAAFFMGNQTTLSKLDVSLMTMLPAIPTLYLVFFLPHLYLGDEKVVDQMLPCAELLSQAVPVGEPFAELGTWLVATK